jgi:hypothetical protein
MAKQGASRDGGAAADQSAASELTLYTGPKLHDLRNTLTTLVARGFEVDNVVDNGDELLDLRIVTDGVNLDDGADEDAEEIATAEAFIALVTQVVGDKKLVRQRKHRRLLRYVLPLLDEYVGKGLDERRTAAGANMTSGDEVVKPGTVRTYYEPRALDELARVLVEMEAEHRGEVWSGIDP